MIRSVGPLMRVYFYVIFGILGACMGSFLNCCAWRIVHHESVLKGRSHCDACGHILGVLDLIPVFSYLIFRGRCRYCGKKFTSRHFWAEIFSAAVFVSALAKWDLSLELIQYLLFAMILLAVSFADLEATIIPDRFIIAAIVIKIIFLLLGENKLQALLFSAIGGFAVAGGLLLVVTVFEKITKKEAMGGGDIKLLFVTGLYLGWKNNLFGLLLGCVFGIIFGLFAQRRRGHEEGSVAFPFGPSIALGAWCALLFGDAALQAYLSLF